MSERKQAGRFTAKVRDGGWPIWIDFDIEGPASGALGTVLSIEELRDLVYVATSALRIAEAAESKAVTP